MSDNARRRLAEKERLRSALAGEDQPGSGPNAAQARDATGDDPQSRATSSPSASIMAGTDLGINVY